MAVLPLSELSGWKLADPSEDLRGLPLADPAGHPLGTITELAVDTETNLIERVVLDDGTAHHVRRLHREGDVVYLLESE
jgi:sporulation protein YlmC with PRC-barrel domain